MMLVERLQAHRATAAELVAEASASVTKACDLVGDAMASYEAALDHLERCETLLFNVEDALRRVSVEENDEG